MDSTNAGVISSNNTIIQPIKSPEAESETPPRIQHTKPISYTNGVLKRHKHHHHHPVVGAVVYKECLKNHAASLGGHALDGCGEFMPAPTALAADPTSLKCAACGCHRNFHRLVSEEVGAGGGATTHVIEYHPQHRHHPLPPPGAHISATQLAVAACRVQSPGSDNDSPPPINSTYYPGSAPHMLLALSSGGGSPDDDSKKSPPTTNNNNNNVNHQTNSINNTTTPTNNNGNGDYHHQQLFGTSPHMPSSRKRFRTKFSQEQKDRMYEFAEKVGWKMLKSNEDLVNGFCNEIGVERGVFKVWMHNNKNTLGKRSGGVAANYGISVHNQGGISINDPIEEDVINGNGVGNSHSSSISNSHHHHQYNNGRSLESNAVPTNGSSCSS